MSYINLLSKDIINLLKFMLGKYNLKSKGKVETYFPRITKRSLKIGSIRGIIKVIRLYSMHLLTDILKLSPISSIKELILNSKPKLVSILSILLLRRISSSPFSTSEIPSTSMTSMMTEVLLCIGHHTLTVSRSLPIF